MKRPVEVECPTCGHKWTVDLDTLPDPEVIYRNVKGKDSPPKTRTDSYRVRCPHDGTWVIIEVEIEE
jgi:hypothetical protein